MNAELERHLETIGTFDSDEDYVENLHHANSPTKQADSMAVPNITLWNKLKKTIIVSFVARPTSILTKIIWTLPVTIALGDYIGLWASFSLVLIFLVILKTKVDVDTDRSTTINQQDSSTSRTFGQTYEMDETSRIKHKKAVNDCRKEVSRLLGLIGAPSLQWTTDASDTLEKELKEYSLKTTDSCLVAIVKFVEAHSQFVLSIDTAYYFLRQSSSIHLGLGPHSQCVERVERAAIAREFRSKRRRKSSASSSLLEGVGGTLEPQNGIDKSVLALTRVRHNLAVSIVNQSESLCSVLSGLEGSGSFEFFIDPLSIPSVVDLGWIKASRQHLAESLSTCTESLCSISVLEGLSLSEEGDNRMRLDDSMYNVRNAREHLLCTLLLGKKPPVMPLVEPNDKLFRSLLNYRIQMDALGVALWSCQQFSVHSIDEETQEKLDEKQNWWMHVQQMSETCRAFEREITESFFPQEEDYDTSPYEEESMTDHGTAKQESGHYEAETKETMLLPEPNHSEKPTRTIVFSGKGSVEDRPKKSRGRKGSNNSTHLQSGSQVLTRDSVSERLVVNELQNRIQTLCPPEEEDEESESEEEIATRVARQPTVPLFLGASGSLLSELKLSMPTTDNASVEFNGE
jgi:hypothetical protein